MTKAFKISFRAGLALLLTLVTAPAFAQGGFFGQWQCQMTYTEFSAPDTRSSGFVRNYDIIFYPNGTFQAAGTESGIGGYVQFESQGQWQQPDNTGVVANGPERSNAPNAFPGAMFVFVGRFQSNGSMASTYEQMDPSQRYVMNRTNIYCERRG